MGQITGGMVHCAGCGAEMYTSFEAGGRFCPSCQEQHRQNAEAPCGFQAVGDNGVTLDCLLDGQPCSYYGRRHLCVARLA